MSVNATIPIAPKETKMIIKIMNKPILTANLTSSFNRKNPHAAPKFFSHDRDISLTAVVSSPFALCQKAFIYPKNIGTKSTMRTKDINIGIPINEDGSAEVAASAIMDGVSITIKNKAIRTLAATDSPHLPDKA